LYSANEGKVVIIADKSQAQDIINFLKKFELSANATIIGKIISVKKTPCLSFN
jgi:hydrogenase maturation factor